MNKNFFDHQLKRCRIYNLRNAILHFIGDKIKILDETTTISSTVITQTSSKTTKKLQTSPKVPRNTTKSSISSTTKPEISSKRPNYGTSESPFETTEITETTSIETSSSASTTQDVEVT